VIQADPELIQAEPQKKQVKTATIQAEEAEETVKENLEMTGGEDDESEEANTKKRAQIAVKKAAQLKLQEAARLKLQETARLKALGDSGKKIGATVGGSGS